MRHVWWIAALAACSVPRGGLPGFEGNDGSVDGGVDSCTPSAEDCNGTDDDCDGSIDEELTSRSCGTDIGTCEAGTETCSGGSWSDCIGAVTPIEEDCTTPMDEDCDNTVDEGCTGCMPDMTRDCGDSDVGACEFGTQTCVGGMWSECEGDVTPVADTCNELDDDCDGMTDEMVRITYYRDMDEDGFGATTSTIEGCAPPMGYVSNSDDCDDAEAMRRPGLSESCDGLDNDCDTNVDEEAGEFFYADMDGDGFGNAASTMQACTMPGGFVTDDSDCDDDCFLCNERFPGELCDGVDNDCDGDTDESCICQPVELSVGVYVVCLGATNWSAARSTCQSIGMELASLETDAENAAVSAAALAIDNRDYWLAGNDRGSGNEGDWRWADGTLFTECGCCSCSCRSGNCNWDSGEPNNSGGEDCLSLRTDADWNDRDCDDDIAYICEF